MDDGYDCDFILIDCTPDGADGCSLYDGAERILDRKDSTTSRDALDDLWNQLESIEDNQQIEIAIIELLANIYRDDAQSQKSLETFEVSYASLAPIFKLPMRVAMQRVGQRLRFFELEGANEQQVERDLFPEVAETMQRVFDKTQVEV